MIDFPRLSELVAAHKVVARIVIAGHKGSTPRETGASMCVWRDGSEGTIGGGRLELEAMDAARDHLEKGGATVRRQALGPALGQCCGGAVTLVSEVWDAEYLPQARDEKSWEFPGIYVRQIEGSQDFPDRIRRQLLAHDDREIVTAMVDGWLIEQAWRSRYPVFIYGAGHVGNALAQALRPLKMIEATLVDVRPDRFDASLVDEILQSFERLPTEVMAQAPEDAAHLIMTPDHDYDLELCHTLLQRPFSYAGLIGSKTKWARFQSRLKALGHEDADFAQIECPIGDPALGKEPEAIAIGVAARLVLLAKTGIVG